MQLEVDIARKAFTNAAGERLDVLSDFGFALGAGEVGVFVGPSGCGKSTMLRILAGTVGIGIAPSQWLLICGLMMALFLGFTKRRAELYALNENGSMHRKVLSVYQPVVLDNMIVVTATCVVLTYSLYTMSPETLQYHHTKSLIYTVPFVMYGIFRYLYSLHRQTAGGDPAVEIFRDPHILLAIVGWLLVTLWLIAGQAK